MIGLFNESFPPLMDGVALTTYNYAYWLHQNGHPVSVVTPLPTGERFAEPFQVFRYPSFPLPKGNRTGGDFRTSARPPYSRYTESLLRLFMATARFQRATGV